MRPRQEILGLWRLWGMCAEDLLWREHSRVGGAVGDARPLRFSSRVGAQLPQVAGCGIEQQPGRGRVLLDDELEAGSCRDYAVVGQVVVVAAVAATCGEPDTCQ